MAFDKIDKYANIRPGAERQWICHSWAWIDNTKKLKVSRRYLEEYYYDSQKELDRKVQRLNKIKYLTRRRKQMKFKQI